MKPVKPLWGFGWAGWCLLAIAALLAAALVTGYDLRFRILELINDAFGCKAMIWFVAVFLPAHGFDFWFVSGGPWMPEMRFTLLAMTFVLVGMQVHPRRHGWVRTAAVVGLGIMAAPLGFNGVSWIHRLRAAPGGSPLTTDVDWLISYATIGCVGAVIVAWAVRSWRLGAVVLATCGLGAWLSAESVRFSARQPPLLFPVYGTERWYTTLAWLTSGLELGCFLTWAIRARLRVFPEHACQVCGYDLRGLPELPCPECGAERAVPGQAPAAAQGVHSPP